MRIRHSRPRVTEGAIISSIPDIVVDPRSGSITFELAELGRGVFEGSPDCVKLLDAHGHILAMNRNGQCAMEIDDFLTIKGVSWATLWTEENRNAINAAVAAARGGRHYHLSLACPTAKGSPRWWDVTVSPIVGHTGEVTKILSTSRDITEARFANEKVRVSEERFRSLVTATAAIVWNTSGTGKFDVEQPGWTAFTGQLFESMTDLGWLDSVHPDDRERTATLWHSGIASGAMYEIEHRLRRADGQFRHMSIRAVPIRAADDNIIEWVGVHSDIDDLKTAQAVRHDNEERVRLATESAKLGLWLWYPVTDHVVWENARPYEIFGISPDAPPVSARRFLTDFIHPDHIADFGHAIATTIETGAHLHFECRIKRTDGELRWVAFFGNRQSSLDGEPLRIIGTVADITAGKDREEELRCLAANLSEADRRKSEFLATLAHELRNPLAPIRHGLQLMRMQEENVATVNQIRDMLDRQVNQMVHLVNDLLDIARITNGKIELRKQYVNVGDLVNMAVETSSPLINTLAHRLIVTVPDEAIHVCVDPGRISQVISNLLNNAAKYTPEGGVIALDVTRDEEEVVVSVTDNGIGIAPESIDAIFGLFRQVGHDFERSQGGLGIGLSLVRQLVELHGGTASATSAGQGGGSTFTIRLGVVNDAPVPLTLKEMLPEVPEAKPLKIMVADDNVDAAEILSMLLQVSGHVTEVVHNGHAAVQLARDFQPDIALLDIGMPGMNGYEVAKALRQIPSLANMTLVALTGWGGEQDRALSQEAGFDRHLLKPVDMQVIESLFADFTAARQSSGVGPS
ncbi:PAS domain-containing protein [Massilia sp. CMS3.1]|uniref:hybrid sensor histidine kinase/response regulator n=1 Tax=Massilia sp. CMS3.1 TaxID=3373083 RepID=UPI003EE68A7B